MHDTLGHPCRGKTGDEDHNDKEMFYILTILDALTVSCALK